MTRLGLLFFIALTLVQNTSVFAQTPSSSKPESKVRWTESVPTALKQSRETGRPLIVYFTADYCGYCRKMERETWSDSGVARRIQNEFVALKLDAEQNEELVARLGVKGLPTTIIFDADGQRVQTISGYSRPAAVIASLDSVTPGRATIGPAEAGSNRR